MGALTAYLQREFDRQCPRGWMSRKEVRLLRPDIEGLLGYGPRADVLLERSDGSRRLWVEFEVSRADPVANHAKFATAHLFQPQLASDSFVSMVSPHVTRGRRNLAANTVSLMRHVGMSAFQTVLLPHLTASEVQRLNHLGLSGSAARLPNVQPEIERALAVSEPVLTAVAHRVYLVGDVLEALLNVRRWNEEMETDEGRALWGRRTVEYFVFDGQSGCFAPAKFCAYVPITGERNKPCLAGVPQGRETMTLGLYCTLDGTDNRFDGHRAQTHLTQALAMRRVGDAGAANRFWGWVEQQRGAVAVHPSGPVIFLPPAWFR
jgi:hypothetical protein